MLTFKFSDGKEYKIGALSLYDLEVADERRDKEKKVYTDIQWTFNLMYSSFREYNPETKASYKEFLKMFPLVAFKEKQDEIRKLFGLKNPVKEAAKKAAKK